MTFLKTTIKLFCLICIYDKNEILDLLSLFNLDSWYKKQGENSINKNRLREPTLAILSVR